MTRREVLAAETATLLQEQIARLVRIVEQAVASEEMQTNEYIRKVAERDPHFHAQSLVALAMHSLGAHLVRDLHEHDL